jgi:DNA-binding SARP family transcriptional activator
VRFRVLGPVEVHTDDGRILTLPRRQERCLLAILLLAAGQAVPADRLCDLLWPDHPPQQPQRVLRSQIARLRSLLRQAGAAEHGVALTSRQRGYLLTVDPDTVDAHRFRCLLDAATRTADLPEREALLNAATAEWHGPALHHAATDELRQRLCADLDELRLHAIEESIATGLELGRHRELLPELARLNAEHSICERLIELHMLALYRTGRTADALDVYTHARTRLADTLGIDPGPDLQQTHMAILRGEPLPPAHEAAPLVVSATAPLGPTAARAVCPAQLPPDPAGFAGRVEHLRQLDAVLSDARSGSGAAIVICAIAGSAGVGKTALAVHWAHQVRDRFPDGQLYVNLRGFDPTGSAMAPADAVRGFLQALDVPADRIPADLDARIGLYRSLLADKQVLVVLDNARDADQVRPLLPGASGCLALVTSRDRLGSLVAVEGAYPIMVDLLTPVEARLLLRVRLGAHRVAAEPDAADRIIDRCARLPLALAVVCARAASHPGFALSALADELGQSRTSLDALDGGDTATDVRAVFSWSYHALSEGAARLFRLLGVHPGPDISVAAAASLGGLAPRQVRLLLAELSRAHLISEHKPGRYMLHDLLRAYAHELGDDLDAALERRAAARRVFDHYLHTAHTAAILLNPMRHPVPLAPAQPGVTAETLTGRDRADGWFTAENRVLMAAVAQAGVATPDARLWQLGWALSDVLIQSGQPDEILAVHRAALDAARRQSDPEGQAHAHHGLAIGHHYLGQPDDARAHWTAALTLYRELDDLFHTARTHLNLAAISAMAGRRGDALHHAEQSFDLFRATEHKAWQARALGAVGWARARLGRHDEALTASQQALAMLQAAGDIAGQADVWDSLGLIHHQLHHHDEAAACLRHARDRWHEYGERHYEANTLAHLGDYQHDAGEPEAAREAWRQALTIYEQIHHAAAETVKDKLDRSTEPRRRACPVRRGLAEMPCSSRDLAGGLPDFTHGSVAAGG